MIDNTGVFDNCTHQLQQSRSVLEDNFNTLCRDQNIDKYIHLWGCIRLIPYV